jgi:hypothetical protein
VGKECQKALGREPQEARPWALGGASKEGLKILFSLDFEKYKNPKQYHLKLMPSYKGMKA